MIEELPPEIAKRRVPCLIAYLDPFRIVETDTLAPWQVSIEDVNTLNWDYVKLHEIVGGIDANAAILLEHFDRLDNFQITTSTAQTPNARSVKKLQKRLGGAVKDRHLN